MVSPEQLQQSLFEIRSRLLSEDTPPAMRVLLQQEQDRLLRMQAGPGGEPSAAPAAGMTNTNTVLRRIEGDRSILAELAKTLGRGGDKAIALKAWRDRYFPDASPLMIKDAIALALRGPSSSLDAYADARWSPDDQGEIMGRLTKPQLSGPEQEGFDDWYREKNPGQNIMGALAGLGGVPSPYGLNSKSYREYWKQMKAGKTLDAELALNLR